MGRGTSYFEDGADEDRGQTQESRAGYIKRKGTCPEERKGGYAERKQTKTKRRKIFTIHKRILRKIKGLGGKTRGRRGENIRKTKQKKMQEWGIRGYECRLTGNPRRKIPVEKGDAGGWSLTRRREGDSRAHRFHRGRGPKKVQKGGRRKKRRSVPVLDLQKRGGGTR